MKYLKRILGLPFFLMLNIIGMIFNLCKVSKYFILYGGEAMAYDKKTTPKMIADLFYELESQRIETSSKVVIPDFCPVCDQKGTILKQVNSTNLNCVSCGHTLKK